jgi:SAM-dependent methyltransferase
MAAIYRQGVIRRNLDRFVEKYFYPQSRLLHAGCGSGQVDGRIQGKMHLTGLDISPEALRLYARNNPQAEQVVHGSIFDLPFPEGSFDGVYNLGVVEHFTVEELDRIFAQFSRVLKSEGKLLIFWPHRLATSVWFLRAVRRILTCCGQASVQFHPAEITYCRDRVFAKDFLAQRGFRLVEYSFGWRDLFVQAVLVAEKSSDI